MYEKRRERESKERHEYIEHQGEYEEAMRGY